MQDKPVVTRMWFLKHGIQLYEHDQWHKPYYYNVNMAALNFFLTGNHDALELAFGGFIDADAFRGDYCGKFSDDILRIYLTVGKHLPEELQAHFVLIAVQHGIRLGSAPIRSNQQYINSYWTYLYLITGDKHWKEKLKTDVCYDYLRGSRMLMVLEPSEIIRRADVLAGELIKWATPDLTYPGKAGQELLNSYVYYMGLVSSKQVAGNLKWLATRYVEKAVELGNPLYLNAADLEASKWDEVDEVEVAYGAV